MIHSEYLHQLFDTRALRDSVELAARALSQVQFDAIAVTGNSGTIFGGALSLALDKPLLLVRKREDNSHSYSRVEGDFSARTYVMVDDIISTGETLRRVVHHLQPMTLVGAYTYRGTGGFPIGYHSKEELEQTPHDYLTLREYDQL